MIKQDEPITIEVLHAVAKILSAHWDKEMKGDQRPKELECIIRMALWFIGGFCMALQGEEMLLIKLAATMKSLKHLE